MCAVFEFEGPYWHDGRRKSFWVDQASIQVNNAGIAKHRRQDINATRAVGGAGQEDVDKLTRFGTLRGSAWHLN
jgi:hypothetical protein